MKKGETRNPGGRPKTSPEFKELAEKNSVPALKVIIAAMNNKRTPEKVRIDAAEMIINRVYGKPNQSISGPDGGPIETKDRTFSPEILKKLGNLKDDELLEFLRNR